MEPKEHYFKRCIFCHYSPLRRFPQFVFHNRGRCTREAEQKCLEDVTRKIYLYPDGVSLYKCYDVCELIVRVVCLLHMRRSLYKLRQLSNGAGRIIWIVDMLFYEGREIKRRYWDPEVERCFACL